MLQNLEEERERATRGTKGTRILCFLCFLWLDPLTFEGFATPSEKEGNPVFRAPSLSFELGNTPASPGLHSVAATRLYSDALRASFTSARRSAAKPAQSLQRRSAPRFQIRAAGSSGVPAL